MVEVEGTVDAKGATVKAETSDKLKNLYKVARRAKDDANINQAFKYYEQIVLEDPDSWEATFFVAFFSAMQNLKEGEIDSPISLIANCLDSVYDIIENIQDSDEQIAAMSEISNKIDLISEILRENSDEECDYYFRKMMANNHPDRVRLSGQLAAQKLERQEKISNIRSRSDLRKRKVSDSILKRRFSEYWEAHQSKKAELESEKKSLAEQIATLNEEISEIPHKVDGYTDMIELQKKVKKLTSEKSALGIFKFGEKKAVQMQIDSTNNAIAPIQTRIDSAIAEVQKHISSLEDKIEEIDIELTKPR